MKEKNLFSKKRKKTTNNNLEKGKHKQNQIQNNVSQENTASTE